MHRRRARRARIVHAFLPTLKRHVLATRAPRQSLARMEEVAKPPLSDEVFVH